MIDVTKILGTAADGSKVTGETADSILHVPVSVLTGLILGVIALAEVGYVVLSYFIYKEFGWQIFHSELIFSWAGKGDIR